MGPPYNPPVLASQDYYEPASVGEAIDLLHRGGGNYKLIAGGTDVIINLRRHTERCRALINIKKMPDIATWSADAGKGLHIGAATPFRELERSTTVIQQYPALLESMVVIGSLQLRNQATIGGNLCNASPAADSAPSLMVYGAMVTYVDDGQGERTLPVEQFFADPGRSVLGPTGVLLRVDVPEPTKDTGACYLRFTPRSAMDIAIASVASRVTLEPSSGRIQDVAIALGAVAPTPVRAQNAEDALRGQEPTQATLSNAAELAKEDCSPISDLRGSASYRSSLIEVLVRRTLESAVQRAREKAST